MSRFCLRSALSLPEGQFQGPILICRYPMAVSVFVADAVSLARSSVEEIYSSHGSWLYDFLRNLRKLPAFLCFFRKNLMGGFFHISRNAARRGSFAASDETTDNCGTDSPSRFFAVSRRSR
jgi:hypothetical protein